MGGGSRWSSQRWTLPPTRVAPASTLSFLEILKHVSYSSTLANLDLQKTSFKMWSGTGTVVTVIWWTLLKGTIGSLESAGPRWESVILRALAPVWTGIGESRRHLHLAVSQQWWGPYCMHLSHMCWVLP